MTIHLRTSMPATAITKLRCRSLTADCCMAPFRGEPTPWSGSGSSCIGPSSRPIGASPSGSAARYHRSAAMSAPYEIRDVEHLGEYRLRLTFADGVVTDVDLAEKLGGDVGPVFEPLRDVAYFGTVTVDPELGTIVWPNGADLAPD